MQMPGKYKDPITDIVTEDMGHVEMIATMVARLLEGASATATTRAAGADPVVGAMLGWMDPQQAIHAGGDELLRRPRWGAIGRRQVVYRLNVTNASHLGG